MWEKFDPLKPSMSVSPPSVLLEKNACLSACLEFRPGFPTFGSKTQAASPSPVSLCQTTSTPPHQHPQPRPRLIRRRTPAHALSVTQHLCQQAQDPSEPVSLVLREQTDLTASFLVVNRTRPLRHSSETLTVLTPPLPCSTASFHLPPNFLRTSTGSSPSTEYRGQCEACFLTVAVDILSVDIDRFDVFLV